MYIIENVIGYFILQYFNNLSKIFHLIVSVIATLNKIYFISFILNIFKYLFYLETNLYYIIILFFNLLAMC